MGRIIEEHPPVCLLMQMGEKGGHRTQLSCSSLYLRGRNFTSQGEGHSEVFQRKEQGLANIVLS